MTTPEIPGGRIGQLVEIMMDCFALALVEADAVPCRLSRYPSPVIPWDVCCICDENGTEGQATVALTRVRPVEDGRGSPCLTLFEAEIVLGLVRCMPSVNEEGEAPSAEELDEAALKQLRDFQILRSAACCWAENASLPNGAWRYGDWVSQPASGGCMASTLTVIARVALKCC